MIKRCANRIVPGNVIRTRRGTGVVLGNIRKNGLCTIPYVITSGVKLGESDTDVLVRRGRNPVRLELED